MAGTIWIHTPFWAQCMQQSIVKGKHLTWPLHHWACKLHHLLVATHTNAYNSPKAANLCKISDKGYCPRVPQCFARKYCISLTNRSWDNQWLGNKDQKYFATCPSQPSSTVLIHNVTCCKFCPRMANSSGQGNEASRFSPQGIAGPLQVPQCGHIQASVVEREWILPT